MPPLKDRIISVLQKTETRDLSKLLNYMNSERGFFYVWSGGHDHWIHGTAQHSWRVYQYMLYMWKHPEDIPSNKKALRDPSKAEPALTPEKVMKLTENEIILAGLLHDVGKIRGNNHHATKSRDIIKEYLGKEFQIKCPRILGAIFFHHSIDKNEEYLNRFKHDTLKKLLCKADSMASGTTWNSSRYMESRSQRSGNVHDDIKYLRRAAMDRTRQVLEYGMFLDYSYNFHTIKGYGPTSIEWNWQNGFIQQVKDGNGDNILAYNVKDVISAAHNYHVKDGKTVCVAVGMDWTVVDTYERILRQDNPNEESLLICSNLLTAFYSGKCAKEGFKYSYQMRDNIQELYRKQAKDKGVYLPQVTFFRDGDDKGLRMVEPWKCDVLLIPGWCGNAIIDMTSENDFDQLTK